jgi:hypothetical protein
MLGVKGLSRRKSVTSELSPFSQGYYYQEGALYKELKTFVSQSKGRYNTNIYDNKTIIDESLRKKDLIERYNGLMARTAHICTNKHGKNFSFEPDPVNPFGQIQSGVELMRHSKELN